MRTSAPNICRSTPCSTPEVEKSGWIVTGLTQNILIWPPVAPVEAAAVGAAADAVPETGATALVVGAAALAVGAATLAAEDAVGAAAAGALVAGAAADAPGGGVGFGAVRAGGGGVP